jgi:hypothetical protein
VDYVPSSPICEGEETLLWLLWEVLHELPFLPSGCAGSLPVSVDEAVPACVQAAQVEAGEIGRRQETSLKKPAPSRCSYIVVHDPFLKFLFVYLFTRKHVLMILIIMAKTLSAI